MPGPWSIARTEPGSATTPGELAENQRWTPAIVPGTAAQAFEAAGLWSRAAPTPLHDADIWFRCHAPARPAAAIMHCAGLAGIAEIWLDEHLAARSTSMFRAVDVDLPRAATTIHLCFRSLTRAIAGRRRGRWRPRLIRDPSVRTVRQTLLGHMPGWCPDIDIVGPYREITVQDAASPRLDLRTSWDVDGGHVAVTLVGVDDERGLLVVGDAEIPLRRDGASLIAEAALPHVEPWWPHTHGRPILYPASIRLAGRTLELAPLGFRRIELDRGSAGRDVRVMCNGVPVFCRGAAWMPPDLVAIGAADATDAALIQLADSNANMVRLPGVGLYETDQFYGSCDRLGIMVWQDFMFASLDYPADDLAFRETVAAEARELLDRLQTSPSLAVLCGGSEVAQQAAMLGLEPARWTNALFEQVLPDAVAALRPDVAYVAHSPGGPATDELALPFATDLGVSHYYGVGAYGRSFDDAGVARVRFASECLALAHVPDAGSLERVMGSVALADPAWTTGAPRDLGAAWDFTDVRDDYLDRMGAPARTLRATDPARYLDLSRAVSCRMVDAVFSVWRDPEVGTGGGLIWLLRDVKPGAGWGLVDIAGVAKPVWHALAQAWGDPAVLIADRGLDGLRLCVVNEQATELRARLSIACLRDGQTAVAAGACDVTVPARGAIHAGSTALLGRFFDITYAYRFGPPAHDVTIVELTDPDGALLAAAVHRPHAPELLAQGDVDLSTEIVADGEGWALRVATSHFAQYVHVRHDGLAADPDWIHVWPSRPRVLRLRRTADPLAADGEVRALNARRPARYRIPA